VELHTSKDVFIVFAFRGTHVAKSQEISGFGGDMNDDPVPGAP
jgi:hypothetical protein